MSEIDYQERKDRENVAAKLLDGYRVEIRALGINEKRLAQEMLAGLNATKPELQKIKGQIENLDPRWEVIANSRVAFLEDEATGKVTTVAKGDTVVMTHLIDHGIRQKVRKDAEQRLGLSDDFDEMEGKAGAIIIVRTEVPEPDPLPDMFKEGADDGEAESRFTDDSDSDQR